MTTEVLSEAERQARRLRNKYRNSEVIYVLTDGNNGLDTINSANSSELKDSRFEIAGLIVQHDLQVIHAESFHNLQTITIIQALSAIIEACESLCSQPSGNE
jgi:hypothetical protein